MTVAFEKIEVRGGNPVSVFRGEYLYLSDGYGDPGTFCLNEESLLMRIDNLGKIGLPHTEEDAALACLRAKAEGEG